MKPFLDFVRTAGIVVVAMLVAVFVVQNLAPVEVNFLFWSAYVPRAVSVLVSLGLGIAVGVLMCALAPRRV